MDKWPGIRLVVRRIATVVILLIGGESALLLAATGRLEVVGGIIHNWGQIEGGWNFGSVTLKNNGDADLVLEEITVACGCTRIDSSNAAWAGIGRVIPPGGSRELHIAMDLSGYNGPVAKSITICTTDDGLATNRTITVTGVVAPTITLVPSQNMLAMRARIGVESPASIRIINTGSNPFVLSPPQLAPGGLAVRFAMVAPVTVAPGESFVVEAFITPLLSTDLYRTARLVTTNPEKPLIDLFISVALAR